MIRYILLVLLFSLKISAQEKFELSREEAEAIFINNNLLLIAEKLNIESQRAEVIQACLWPNPEFSINEINFWKTTGVESSPPIFGKFGRDQQFAFEINQLIQTAGKRKKLIALEEIEVSKTEQFFEDLLRNLKFELRSQLTDFQFNQLLIDVHQNLIENISVLIQAYQNQLERGSVSGAELTRLKAQEILIKRQLLELKHEKKQIQKELKHLLGVNPTLEIEITNEGFAKPIEMYENILLEQLMVQAKVNRPDYQLALLEEKYSHHLLSFEKSKRIPDLTFGINYDRNGSTMLDFVGFGVSFDLPFFDRNQGNIQKAEIQINQAEILKEHTLLKIENEIFQTHSNLLEIIEFIHSIDENYENDLDELLDSYTKNYRSRNLNMLEYFHFLETYLENKIILIEAQKEFNHIVEELNYLTGIDI